MGMHEGLALVLDAKDYRETSSLVQLLTENEGRISLVAKGLRKGKGGAGPATMQPFSLVRVRYNLKEGATMGNLASADLERAYPAARESLEAYALVSYWFEILKEISQPREAGEQIFAMTRRFLENQEMRPGVSVEFLMELSALCGLMGFGLEWQDCVGCGQGLISSDASRFSIRNGGLLCTDCVGNGIEGLLLRPEEIRVTQKLRYSEKSSPGEDEVEAGNAERVVGMLGVLGLVHRFLVYHLEHPLQTYVFVQSVYGIR